jgi:5'-nucleotidase
MFTGCAGRLFPFPFTNAVVLGFLIVVYRTRTTLLVVLVGCSSATPAETESQTVVQAADEPVTLTIIAINDFHGALYEVPWREDSTEVCGGLPWLVGALDYLRVEDPELLLLDGGDVFQGAWPVNATRGRGAVEAFNLLEVDAAAVGNHEFDYGPGVEASTHPLRGALEEASELAEFTWLTSNVYGTSPVGSGAMIPLRWQPGDIEPWTIIERRGVQVGLIGLSTTDTPTTTLHRHVADLRFSDPVEAVREALPHLEEAGAQVVIVVGHLTGRCESAGSECRPGGELGRLLTELPVGSIDVIVAGHEHAEMAFRQDDTFVLQTYGLGSSLNRLDLVIGPDGVDADASNIHTTWHLIHDRVDPRCEEGEFPLEPRVLQGVEITPSAEALALIERLEDEAGSLCDPVGCTAWRMPRSSSTEAEVGNLVADALRAAFDDADVAIQNSGGIRAGLPPGTIRRQDIHTLMPFENRLLLVEMTGERLVLLFRIGTSGAHGVPQVSGASFRYDPTIATGDDLDGDGEVAAWEKDRLCEVTVGGEPIDPERLYRVVVPDFLVDGGDHFAPAFEGATVLEQGALVRDVLYEYLESQDGCLGDSGPLVDAAAPRIVLGACDEL